MPVSGRLLVFLRMIPDRLGMRTAAARCRGRGPSPFGDENDGKCSRCGDGCTQTHRRHRRHLLTSHHFGVSRHTAVVQQPAHSASDRQELEWPAAGGSRINIQANRRHCVRRILANCSTCSNNFGLRALRWCHAKGIFESSWPWPPELPRGSHRPAGAPHSV
jgi:hypothetical protein